MTLIVAPQTSSDGQKLLFGTVSSSVPLSVVVDGADPGSGIPAQTSAVPGTLAIGSRVIGFQAGTAFYVLETLTTPTPVYGMLTQTVDATMTVPNISQITLGWPNTATVLLGGMTTTTPVSGNVSGLVIPVTGLYRVEWALAYDVHTTGRRFGAGVLNGVTTNIPLGLDEPVSAGASNYCMVQAVRTRLFTAGDTVGVSAFQSSGTTLSLRFGTYLTVTKQP